MKKITLTLDETVIRDARRLARQRGTTVSTMLTRLVRAMVRGNGQKEQLPPLTRKITGIISLPPGKTDRELIEEAILEKHGFRK